jgi:serine protease Do
MKNTFRLFSTLLFFLCAFAVSAHAEIPESRTEIDLSFAPLVKAASPAVVNIFTSRTVRQQVNPMFDDPFVQRFFGGNVPGGMMRQRVEASLGSGVIIRADGLVVTNAHVIRDASEIRVVLTDRREFPATVALRDDHADLAVLRIDTGGDKLPFLTLADSDKAEVGDLVLAIGNPFGVGQTVTNGIVSALGRSAESLSQYNEFIQTDAPINPGNSGGALLDMSGHLLGINSAIYSRDGGSLGIGFAIPANIVRTTIEAAETGHKPVRPWIGVNGQPVTSDIAATLGLKRPDGLLVDHVTAGSPAAQAGIKQGDVIVLLGDRDIIDMPSMRARLYSTRVDTPLEAVLWRDGAETKVSVTPVAPPETPPRDETRLKGREPFDGATVENISPAVVEDLGTLSTTQGVVISELADNSTATQLGFQVGDVVLAVNGTKIETVKQLVEIAAHPAQQWHLTIRRGDQVINTVLGG